MSKFFDVIHGFIELDALEQEMVQSIPFKRLTCIHQIISASFVYGGGDHKRGDHSLGTMHVASKIYDKVASEENFSLYFPEFDQSKKEYWRRVVRLAALFHDLGHLPFSHLAEADILGDHGHEKWTIAILRSNYIEPLLKKEGIEVEDVAKVAVGEKVYGGVFTPWERVVSEMITGDYFGADRIDYLLRDSYATGLVYGHFDYLQLINNLCLLRFHDSVVLGLMEDGLESCYALLLARYFMHRRLYQYPSVLSYSFHLKEIVNYFFTGKPYCESVENYVKVNDYDILAEMNRALFDENHPCHGHAASIMGQKERISVIPLTKQEVESILKNPTLLKQNLILKTQYVSKRSTGLFFPVFMKNGIVVEAQEITDVSIPVIERSWAFVNQELGKQLKKALGDAAKDSKKPVRGVS